VQRKLRRASPPRKTVQISRQHLAHMCAWQYMPYCEDRTTRYTASYTARARSLPRLRRPAMNDDLGEVTSPSEQQHAPWLPIPSRAISVVEHPCIVKNVDKGITSLGGPVKLSKVGRRRPNTCKRRLTHSSGLAVETGRDDRGRER
jgi:hypothetical protein